MTQRSNSVAALREERASEVLARLHSQVAQDAQASVAVPAPASTRTVSTLLKDEGVNPDAALARLRQSGEPIVSAPAVPAFFAEAMAARTAPPPVMAEHPGLHLPGKPVNPALARINQLAASHTQAERSSTAPTMVSPAISTEQADAAAERLEAQDAPVVVQGIEPEEVQRRIDEAVAKVRTQAERDQRVAYQNGRSDMAAEAVPEPKHARFFEIFYGQDNKAYWHAKALNGDITYSSQGYTDRSSAERSIRAELEALGVRGEPDIRFIEKKSGAKGPVAAAARSTLVSTPVTEAKAVPRAEVAEVTKVVDKTLAKAPAKSLAAKVATASNKVEKKAAAAKPKSITAAPAKAAAKKTR